MRLRSGNKKTGYPNIDRFRMIAALLVVAIHTSPLWSYSHTADFILTRIVARVAVPFFLMTTGYFILGTYCCNWHKIRNSIKKVIGIYGIAILIYLPINFYQGKWKEGNLIRNILCDIFLDGTIYHLWYLPATITGIVILWLLVSKLGKKITFAIVSGLYCFGLLGDSYYGLAQKIPPLNGIFRQWFEISPYTRNGIFFAPLFILLGSMISSEKNIEANEGNQNIRKYMWLSILCFCGMLAEGLTLHGMHLQKHDSMYVFLPGLMYGLFGLLIQKRGSHQKSLGRLSLVVYLIHPMVIIGVHFVTQALGVLDFDKKYSFVNYMMISLISVVVAYLIVRFRMQFPLKNKKNALKQVDDKERSWLEIDRGNLRSNIREMNGLLSDECQIMAVVKANCYGHGGREVIEVFQQAGIRSFAVATIEEGIQLRKNGAEGEILILGYTNPARAKDLKRYDLMQTLVDLHYALELNQQKYKIKCHVKIDTGMHRLGFDSNHFEDLCLAFSLNNLKIQGIYTHLCDAEHLMKENQEFTLKQIRKFYYCLEFLKEKNIPIPKTHIQSSYGVLNYSWIQCDYARIGLSLYGVYSSKQDRTIEKPRLLPAMSLCTQVVLIRKVKKGQSVGYDQSYVTDSERRLAVLPIGYGDGLPRQLSMGVGKVYLNQKAAPIVGKICMDQMTIDITDIPDVKIGTVVHIFGQGGEHSNRVEDIADECGSITNEVLSRLGSRLKIVYIN